MPGTDPRPIEDREPADGTTDRLLTWYWANRRDLPWRERDDAYEIWISEIMLQQTRAETVERYYQRFLDRFPSLGDLAAASEQEVLAQWSGLGYYRRARQLHRAARDVVEGGGELPAAVDDLRRLPGIGPYTAAAIASLAFGLPEPVLDGNVERVLARYRAVGDPPRRAAGKRRLLTMARALLDPSRPGDFNQAMMELGARVCTPRRPDCRACPLDSDCDANARAEQESFPVRSPRRAPEKESWVSVVVRRDGKLLMARRPDDERLMPGMWELPRVRVDQARPTGTRTREASPEEALAQRYGGSWSLEDTGRRVRHGITTRSLEVAIHRATWTPGEVAESEMLHWVGEGQLDEIPTPSLVGKSLAAIATRADANG